MEEICAVMRLQLIFGDNNPDLIQAWEPEFSGESESPFAVATSLFEADALVSPANSFGFMDGGIDWSISEMFGWKTKPLVQKGVAPRRVATRQRRL
jgi:hypothetical protein